MSNLGGAGSTCGGPVLKRPVGVREVIPFEALRSARSLPGIPVWNLTWGFHKSVGA